MGRRVDHRRDLLAGAGQAPGCIRTAGATLLSYDNSISDIVARQQYGRAVPLELVGVAEIAELLGVTRQRVDAIARTHEDFPAPVAEIAAGRIWLRDEIEALARRAGRIPNRRTR